MDRQELGNSPILSDPELPPNFVWSAQTQLSPQYRPQAVSFAPSLICNQPDTFSDNCTWPCVSQPESTYTSDVERRWTSREQPDIHSTAAQWPFCDDESAIHLSSLNGPGRSTSNSFHDMHPSPFLSSRYQDLYEQARRDLDHLPPDSGSCSSQGQSPLALTTEYQDLYERVRSELDNDPPSDLSDSSNGQQPSSSLQNGIRINLERDSIPEHQLFAPVDFPEEDSSGSDSSPGQAPYYDSGYDDNFSEDHRPEVIDQGVILHPHQQDAMPQMYGIDIEQVFLLEVIPVVPQIQTMQAWQNAWRIPIIQNQPTDQRNASSQTSQVDLTVNRTAFDHSWTQNAVEPSHHSHNSYSAARIAHKKSTASNGHFTGNINLRSSKDTVPAAQEHHISPTLISSDSSLDNSILTSLGNSVCSQVSNCKYSLSPSGDCSTSSQDISTSTSSDSNSVAFFPPPHKACSKTLSSQKCHYAYDMTKVALSTKVNSGMDRINSDRATSNTPPESILAKRAHTEIEADDEATCDGFPDNGQDDRVMRRMSRVRRSRRDRNEIRIINGINRHIHEPCNKLPLPKRKRSLSPSEMDAKRARTDVDGCLWPSLQDVTAKSARKETNGCHQTQTSGHDTGSESDSERSIQEVQAGPQRPESSALQSRKRKHQKGQTVKDDTVKKSKKEDVAKRPKGTTKRAFHNLS